MKLDFETDGGAAGKAAIGTIILQNDETLEPEMRTVFPDIAVYHARIPSAPEVTPETLKQMEAELPRTAALLPGGATFSAIGYACTSGSTVIGPDRVRDLVRTVHPAAQVTNPLSAVMAACDALGVRRIGFLTPYVADVSAAMRAAPPRKPRPVRLRLAVRCAPASIAPGSTVAGALTHVVAGVPERAPLPRQSTNPLTNHARGAPEALHCTVCRNQYLAIGCGPTQCASA